MDNFRKILEKVLEKNDLEEGEAFQAVLDLSKDEVIPSSLVAAFLTALRAKGESVSELVGGTRAVLSVARPFPNANGIAADIVGTGGDGKGTCNISTLAALTAAAAGVPVVKHGNRSVSSRCGSADLLEALGLLLEVPEEQAARQLQRCFFAFLYAPFYHPGFKRVAEIRKELGFRTLFNLLGPLANPASPTVRLLGVANKDWLLPMALAAKGLGCRKTWVVHGAGGSDELDLSGENQVISIENGAMKRFVITPEEAGLKRAPLEAIRGGRKEESVALSVRVLQGEKGPLQDAVAFNAGVILYLAGTCVIPEGVALAREILKKGAAWNLVEKLRES